MTMEGLLERAELHRLQKEQERERRRLQDRQRRQSMSLVEREKHLARRRKNYQLRRQRAENAQLDPQIQLVARGEMLIGNQHQALTSASDLSCQCNGAADVGSDRGQEKLNTERTKSQSLEVPGHKLAKFSGRLRLNRLKHLARTLNGPGSELVGNSNETATNVMIKGNATSNCILLNGLRLSHVKHLARALNSTVKETAEQSLDQRKTEGCWVEEL